MNFYSKEILLDQFTPVSIYEKVKSLYQHEITFLFESTINSSDGNYSYIIIGARERVWYDKDTCYYKNEEGEVTIVDSNPLLFLKKYYKNFDKQLYKEKALELGIGLIDGFIGNVGYDIGKEFEPKAYAPTPGALDLCFITTRTLEEVTETFQTHGVEIIEGPVARTGATGPIRSVYVRDPDLNLIEIAVYPADART